MPIESGDVPCVKCGKSFIDLQALRQHSRHSKRCMSMHSRKQKDLEILIRTKMMRSPELLIDDLRKALENVQILAHTFGPEGKVDSVNRGRFALAALKTIENLASVAMIGI